MRTLHANPVSRSILGLLSVVGRAGPVHAASNTPGMDVRAAAGIAQPTDPLAITGRTFAGTRLPLGPVTGYLELTGRRASVWAEPGESPGAGEVRRALLEGEVSVTIGAQRFSADRAAVWLQRIDASGDRPVYQVFAVLDNASLPGADSGMSLAGRRLSVEGVVAVVGGVRMRCDLVSDGRPREPFLIEAERRFAERLRETLGLPTLSEGDPAWFGSGVDERGDERALSEEEISGILAGLDPVEHRQPIFAEEGIISFSFGPDATLSVVPSLREDGLDAAVVTGGLTVFYQDPRQRRSLQMQAERAVVFAPPGSATNLAGGLSPGQVVGIYLEGGVIATDGQYTVRGPQVYYDVQNNRAAIVDAVFWTYDEARRLPLYLRAAMVRQESADQFSAEKVTLATTSFFKPHFSIGASSITLSRRETPAGETRYRARAEDITLYGGGLPLFYVPVYAGDPERLPISQIALDSSTGNGLALKTSWNLDVLLGYERPEGTDAQLIVDAHFTRGLALGADFSWDRPDLRGNLLTYWIFADQGEDRLRTGRDLDQDGDTRGIILLQQRWRVDDEWAAWLEGAYITDETFADAFFEELQTDRPELMTGLYARRLRGNSLLSLEARGSLNDFIINDAALQTPGYVTEKLPEAVYVRQADDLLSGVEPGLVTLFSEYRAGLLRLNFNEPTADELGFRTPTLSQRAFGIDPNESIADRLRDAGYTEDFVTRLDTRQEVVATLDAGPFRITPFLTGRATFWDDDFDEFSPEENDQARFWGAAGVHLSTQILRVHNSVESSVLDLHRLRHVIEPTLSIWHGETNIERASLPTYDEQVEALIDGTVIRFAVDQTWQTQRGGPGRWRSVDVFTLNTELVFSSGTGEDAAIGRFYEFRPEYTRPGDYATVEAIWQVSDAIAVTGSTIFDFETNQQARSSAGVLLDHSPTASTSAELRFVNPTDSTFLDVVNAQAIGDKYTLFSSASYDFDEGDFRSIAGELRREFPDIVVGIGVSYDNIQGETSFGFFFSPRGLGTGARIRGIGGAADTRFGG